MCVYCLYCVCVHVMCCRDSCSRSQGYRQVSQLYGEQGLLCRVSMNIVTLIRAVATTWELGVVKPHPQLIKDVTPFSSALVCSAMKPLPLPLAKPSRLEVMRHCFLLPECVLGKLMVCWMMCLFGDISSCA